MHAERATPLAPEMAANITQGSGRPGAPRPKHVIRRSFEADSCVISLPVIMLTDEADIASEPSSLGEDWKRPGFPEIR